MHYKYIYIYIYIYIHREREREKEKAEVLAAHIDKSSIKYGIPCTRGIRSKQYKQLDHCGNSNHTTNLYHGLN